MDNSSLMNRENKKRQLRRQIDRMTMQAFALEIHVRPTPNPLFRRVDAQVFAEGYPVLRISTIQGR